MESSLAILENLHALPERIDALQAALLTQEQAECPVIHRFGPGIYIREVRIPAGVVAVGRYHRQEQVNIMLTGKVTIVRDDGSLSTIEAPSIFVGKPGRKVGYIHEDMVWQNIYATGETDVQKIEEMIFDDPPEWRLQVQAQKQNTLIGNIEPIVDPAPLPYGNYKFKVSDISAGCRGIFATADISDGEWIAPLTISGKKTVACYVKHSLHPNARKVQRGDDVWLIASRPMCGCRAGYDGEEITVNSEDSIWRE